MSVLTVLDSSSQERKNGLVLVHETPQRLRYKLPFLADPLIDFSWLLTRLESIKGVTKVRVNRRAHSVIFEYDGHTNSRQSIEDYLTVLSRKKIPNGESDPEEIAELAPMLVTGGLIGLIPFISPQARMWLTFLNIGPTLIEGVGILLTKGIKVEVLDAIALGVSAARGEYLTSNITHFLMQLGEYLEIKTERQSDSMLRRLLRPEPMLAWVERDGQHLQVMDDEIRIGERVKVNLGDKIPVDGLVLNGTALVNQAAVTGESVPVRKEVMDRVVAGSVLMDGNLTIEARHVGEDTTTARIAKFIDESIDSGSQTERLADQLADKRVYLTLGTGAMVYLLTGEERRLESVFMVDYSCALKLGTPLAFKSGMYRAASEGILLKGGEAIESMAEIDTVVFDKTGTLTDSRLEVTDVVLLEEDGWTPTRLLAVTASIEEHASHPIAEAIVRQAKAENLNHIDHGEVDYLVAHGMSCPVNGDQLFIGSRHYLEEHIGLDFSMHEEQIVELRNQGKTILYVGTEQEPIGMIALSDTVREDAVDVLQRLRNQGVEHLVMLTGDHQLRAEALANELGIDEVFAEQVPEEKASVIEQLLAEGRKVAFVGDGVNDGPALVAANVGIAMARGAELARATADVVLLEDRLSLLPEALDVSKRTMTLVKQNYSAAIGINTGVMIGAAAGWLSPVASAVLHNGSTVGLLLRSLKGIQAKNTQQEAIDYLPNKANNEIESPYN